MNDSRVPSGPNPAHCFCFPMNHLARRTGMKRLALLLLLGIGLVPTAFAQETDHLQVGVYADYFRLKQTKTNFAGIGARVGIPAIRNVNFEGEINYDFDQAFTEG